MPCKSQLQSENGNEKNEFVNFNFISKFQFELTWTRRKIEIAIFATLALLTVVLAAAWTLSRNEIADVIQRPGQIAIAWQAVGAVVAIGASIAEISSKIGFAVTSAVGRFALIAGSSDQITFARTTIGIAEMTVRTRLTIGWLEFRATFTATTLLFTVTSREEVLAIASWIYAE